MNVWVESWLQNLFVPAIAAACLYSISASSLILSIPLILAVYALTVLFEVRSKERMARERESIGLASALKELHGAIVGRSVPFGSALWLAANSGYGNSQARVLLHRLSARLSLGQNLGDALSFEKPQFNREANAAITGIRDEYGKTGEVKNSLKLGHQRISAASEARNAHNATVLSRHIVLCTVFSTIVPALLLFGFVSYSILSYTFAGLLAFAFVMLLALPLITDVVLVKIDETRI